MSQSPVLVVKQSTVGPDRYRVELELTRAGQAKRSASAEFDFALGQAEQRKSRPSS